MLQSDAVCCSVLQCVAVCCSVLQCGVEKITPEGGVECNPSVAVAQCVAYVAVCCSVLQCVAVCNNSARGSSCV